MLERDELNSKIRNSALASLTRREHSCEELRRKLEQKFAALDPSAGECIEQVLAWLVELNYLNDGRFAEGFVRMSVVKGRGPRRIEQELLQRGISRDQVQRALQQAEVDWLSHAADTLARKFSEPVHDARIRAKQMRYLQYRGFLLEHIYPLF